MCTIFTRHNTPTVTHLKLGNHIYPYENQISYLGIILDKKLNWGRYVDRIVTKCEKGLNFLKMIAKTWWGAHPNTLLVFYQSYIRSIIDYGSILYGSASNSILKRVDTVQNKALRICIGAMKSTPLIPLHVETQEPPLQYRRQFLSEKYVLQAEYKHLPIMSKISQLSISDLTNKYWSKKNSPPLCYGFRQTSEDRNNLFTISDIPHWNLEYLDLFFEPLVLIPAFSDIPSVNRIILKNLESKFQSYLHIYTDASKILENVGCAVYIPSNKFEVKIKLTENTSVYVGEAIAVLKALEYINCNQVKKAVIYTDSLSVLTNIKNSVFDHIHTNSYILQINLLLCKLYKDNTLVYFVWVKAHVGILHNEHVDHLAKESALSDLNIDFKACLSDCINSFKHSTFYNWSKSYKNYQTDNPMSQYSQVVDHIPKSPWFKGINASRKFITTICRIRFGHACFPKHLSRIGVLESDICSTCGIIGDLDHIFFGCQNYEIPNNDLLKNLIELNIPLPTNVIQLLSLNSIQIYNLLVNFLNNIKLLL